MNRREGMLLALCCTAAGTALVLLLAIIFGVWVLGDTATAEPEQLTATDTAAANDLCHLLDVSPNPAFTFEFEVQAAADQAQVTNTAAREYATWLVHNTCPAHL